MCLIFRLSIALLGLPLFAAAASGPLWPTAGWPVSTPEEQGMDPAALAQADAYIRANCPTRRSFMVVRNGYLVYERYYLDTQPDGIYNIASISKSYLAAVAGLALKDGTLPNLDRKVLSYFPEYVNASTDPRKWDMTLRHLLTMTAGFPWDDVGPIFTQWVNSPDWLKFMLDLPLQFNPGGYFTYDTGLAHLFSGALTKAAGMATEQYARNTLFGPLGISSYRWDKDPLGYSVGGFRMYLSSRDAAKLGYLFLRKGVWEDRQLLPEGWVDLCWKLQAHNYTQVPLGDYGYFWWIRQLANFDVKAAMGFGGQYIFVVPDLDLIVVTTATIDSDTLAYHSQAATLLTSFAIPAVQGAAPAITAGGVVSAAGYTSPIAPDSLISVFGENLSPSARSWDTAILDGTGLPATMASVRARIDGRDCYLNYVSPGQLNVLLPPSVPAGARTLEVSNWRGSVRVEVTVAPAAPGLFTYSQSGRSYPSAILSADGARLGVSGIFPGVISRPARPGEYVELYATGLGPAAEAHPVGQVITQPIALADTGSVRVTIGGRPAAVPAVMMTYAGVYQINVRVPDDLPAGDQPITIEVSGQMAQSGILFPVQAPAP